MNWIKTSERLPDDGTPVLWWLPQTRVALVGERCGDEIDEQGTFDLGPIACASHWCEIERPGDTPALCHLCRWRGDVLVVPDDQTRCPDCGRVSLWINPPESAINAPPPTT